jgi:hypothetical protein
MTALNYSILLVNPVEISLYPILAQYPMKLPFTEMLRTSSNGERPMCEV